MTKATKTKAAETKKTKVASAKASNGTTSEAPKTAKTRSQHLKKLLALRAEGKKIKKPGKSTGLSNSSVKKTTAKKTTTKKAAAAAAPAPAPPPKPAAKKRTRKKAPYGKRELKELRDMLEEERVRLLRDLRQLDDLADSNRQTTHATFSSHQADAASDSSALESTFIQRRYEEERFAAVSEALVRLENGTYGMCDFCADEPKGECETCPFIPVGRLKAKPFARMCVQLRQKMEKNNRRY